MMTLGGRGQLGNDFGGSTKELSPRKVNKNLLIDKKLVKSELSLNHAKDNSEVSPKVSSSLLNLLIPFSWKWRVLTNRSDGNKDKKKSNMLTNFWKKKRVDTGVMCNKR